MKFATNSWENAGSFRTDLTYCQKKNIWLAKMKGESLHSKKKDSFYWVREMREIAKLIYNYILYVKRKENFAVFKHLCWEIPSQASKRNLN